VIRLSSRSQAENTVPFAAESANEITKAGTPHGGWLTDMEEKQTWTGNCR